MPPEIERLYPRWVGLLSTAKFLPALFFFFVAATRLGMTSDQFLVAVGFWLLAFTVVVPPLVLQVLRFNTREWGALAAVSSWLVGLDLWMFWYIGSTGGWTRAFLLVLPVLIVQFKVLWSALTVAEQLVAQGLEQALAPRSAIGRLVAQPAGDQAPIRLARAIAISQLSLGGLVVGLILAWFFGIGFVWSTLFACCVHIALSVAQVVGFMTRRWRMAAMTSGVIVSSLVVNIVMRLDLVSEYELPWTAYLDVSLLLLPLQILIVRDSFRLVAGAEVG